MAGDCERKEGTKHAVPGTAEDTHGGPGDGCDCIDQKAVWDWMDAHRVSQKEEARRASSSRSHLSQIMAGKATPSPMVLQRLHGVLYRQAPQEERSMPAEVQIVGWRRGERSEVVVRGAGAPGGSATVCPGVRRWSMPTPRATTAAGAVVGDARGQTGLLRFVVAAG